MAIAWTPTVELKHYICTVLYHTLAAMQTNPQHTEKVHQKARSERTRNIICETTVACLAELAYAETTINNAVERTMLLKDLLQHHFPGKETKTNGSLIRN
jgi:hypothetical protein